MIVNKNTKLVQDRIGCNYNWLGDDWIYVKTGSELGNKIRDNAPYFDFVFDEIGNLIDVEPTTKPEPAPTEEIDTDETLLDHEYRITMLELGI